jgi:hypothetical protein
MSLRGLRLGEWLALGGAVALAVLLSLRWFDAPAGVSGAHESGWASLGWGLALVLALCIAGAVALASVTALRSVAAFAMLATVATVPFAFAGLVALVLRLAFFQPTLGVGLPASEVGVRWPAYLAVPALALLLGGMWHAMNDDRVEDPESAYDPPPPRAGGPGSPAPGGTLSA